MRLPGPRLPALHLSDRPSATALGVTVTRALEARRPVADRIVDDPYAERFLPAAVRATLPALTRARRVVDLPEHNSVTGMQTFVACRHRFIDDHVLMALREGAEQLVLLGAGYDSRAYRFAAELAGRPVYEVDLPPLSRLKARIVETQRATFGESTVRRVEIDFRTQSLTSVLDDAGFERDAPTAVVWEGVTPYLSREAVRATLTDLHALVGRGSTLALDLWDGGGSGALAPVRRLSARSLALLGEPVTDAVPTLAAAPLLGEHGFDLVDLAEGPELTARYATDGRVAATSIYTVAATA